jgi:superfamily II DNA or RNA helicase
MKDLLRAVQAAMPARIWDQGVKLARAGAVQGDSAAAGEVVLRVQAPGRAAALTVVLYPEDQEWDCDCGANAACSHVAAAVIALSQSRDHGQELPQSQRGRLRYRFRSEAGRLFLDRLILAEDGSETPLRGRLFAPAATGVTATGVKLLTTPADLTVDRELGLRSDAALRADQIGPILSQLADTSEVYLAEARVRTSGEVVVPRAVVRDASRGVELVLERDPDVECVVAAGVVLVDGCLRPLGETELTGRMLEALPFVRHFEPADLAALVTGLLPELAQRISVEITTDRLPGISRTVKPRVAIELEQSEDKLSVFPTLVYGDPVQARIDGDRMVHVSGAVPVRDRAAEKRLVFELRDHLNLVPGRRVEVSGKDAIGLAQRLAAWRGQLGAGARDLFSDYPLEAHLEIEGDAFDVSFSGAGGRSADPAAVIRAWRSGERLVPLLGKGWAPLPAAFLDQYGHLIADLLASRDDNRRVARYALPDLARLCRELDHPPPPGLEELRPLIEEFCGIPAAELPGDFAAELRGYQRAGVSWLVFLRRLGLGAVLADDMGLGKTVQALCALRGTTLVVCPTSVLHNWAAETARFRPALRVCRYHGPGRELDEDADLIITSYAILRLDIELLAARHWDAVILDEAQHIKNPDSQVAAAAYRLDADFRLTLTGTPIENRLDELWSQFHFTNPGLLGGRSDFRDRYARPIADGEQEAAKRLRARIRPFVLRRLKRDVARELPPRTEAVLHCELNGEERVLYDAVLAAARRDVVVELESGSGVMAALEALLRLRQAACHSALLPGRSAPGSAKTALLLELLEEVVAEGHKALVFSQWTSMLDLCEPHLHEAAIPFIRLDGSTRDRAGVVADFQNADGPPVLLVSLKAGGTGLNLTAADHVILMDPWWNPAVEDQAADRAHRIGQDKPVFVYRLVARDTVEERVLELQARKRALFDAALGDAAAAGAITRADLLALLS